MALWVLTAPTGGGGGSNNQGYVNLDLAQHVFAYQYGTDWILQAYFPADGVATLNGAWGSEQEALSAAGKLMRGVDPGQF